MITEEELQVLMLAADAGYFTGRETLERDVAELLGHEVPPQWMRPFRFGFRVDSTSGREYIPYDGWVVL